MAELVFEMILLSFCYGIVIVLSCVNFPNPWCEGLFDVFFMPMLEAHQQLQSISDVAGITMQYQQHVVFLCMVY